MRAPAHPRTRSTANDIERRTAQIVRNRPSRPAPRTWHPAPPSMRSAPRKGHRVQRRCLQIGTLLWTRPRNPPRKQNVRSTIITAYKRRSWDSKVFRFGTFLAIHRVETTVSLALLMGGPREMGSVGAPITRGPAESGRVRFERRMDSPKTVAEIAGSESLVYWGTQSQTVAPFSLDDRPRSLVSLHHRLYDDPPNSRLTKLMTQTYHRPSANRIGSRTTCRTSAIH